MLSFIEDLSLETVLACMQALRMILTETVDVDEEATRGLKGN